MTMPSAPEKFTLPQVLICEGEEDKAFFDRLIAARNLPNFHIRTTATSRGGAGGNSKFGDALRRLRLRNIEMIKHILLVTDADDDWNQRFGYVCDQIIAADFGPPPNKPFEPSKSKPPITVMIIPTDLANGCLECICEASARSADVAMATIIDEFVARAGRDKWPTRHHAKVWLRVNLAARADDPFVFLGNVFRDPNNHNLIPLEHSSLTPIADVLSAVGASRAPRQKAVAQVASEQSGRKRVQTPPNPRMRPTPGRHR
jgi:hypothetical protein